MKAEELSLELLDAIKEIAEQFCKENALVYKPIYKGANLFNITKELLGADFRYRWKKSFNIIVRCYLFEHSLSPAIVNGVPSLRSCWMIRFHLGSELKPTGLLEVEDLEQHVLKATNEPARDRVLSSFYWSLDSAWSVESENIEADRIIS